jgi:hypothetical protein
MRCQTPRADGTVSFAIASADAFTRTSAQVRTGSDDGDTSLAFDH